MARFSPIRVNYVALYFRDWLPVFQTLSTIECGIYWRLCCFIYEAGGRLEHKTALLASLSGLSELEFSTHWSRLKHKFVQTGDYLYHKRCTKELQATNRLVQASRKGGINSAKARGYGKGTNNKENEVASRGVQSVFEPYNLTNTILKNTINTKDGKPVNPIFNKVLDKIPIPDNSKVLNSFSAKDKSSLESDKLALYGALSNFLVLQEQSQKTCLNNICKWAVNHPQAGREFYRQVIDFADEARKKAKTNRWGYFLGGLRRQLGYVPGKIVN